MEKVYRIVDRGGDYLILAWVPIPELPEVSPWFAQRCANLAVLRRAVRIWRADGFAREVA